MNGRCGLLFTLPLVCLLAGCKPGPERLVGTRNGKLEPGGIAAKIPGMGGLGLRLAFTFQKRGDTLTGTLTSLDQGSVSVPVDSVTYKEGAVEAQVNQLFAKFSGTLSKDGKQLAGTWSQGPLSLPLTLAKQE